MKPYLLSLAAGVIVGLVYGGLNVRPPAPPIVALVGLLGMLAGEQIVPMARELISDRPLSGLSGKDAIAGIESGKYAFWTRGGGEKTDVIIAVSGAGNKYLKTRADTTTKDNLLSLPECPR